MTLSALDDVVLGEARWWSGLTSVPPKVTLAVELVDRSNRPTWDEVVGSD